jgi:hypothetical protein
MKTKTTNKMETKKDEKGIAFKPLLAAVFMLLIWGVITLILGISVVGWVALAMMADDDDGWFQIPTRCAKALT